MSLKRLMVAAALLGAAGSAALLAWALWPAELMSRSALGRAFVPLTLPASHTRELFDIGVTDIDGDDHHDIYSANHNTRQILWVSDGRGGYRDMLSAWSLDQDPALPGTEISDDVPAISDPGLYIYWQGRNAHSHFPLIMRTHRLKELGPLQGSLQTYSAIRSYDAGAFDVQPPAAAPESDGQAPRTTMRFAADRDGTLEVIVASPGVPITVRLDESIGPKNVFVGAQKARPQQAAFDLFFQDRHGLAWSDFNGDGKLDVFISRGAIGGMLRRFPPDIQARVQDELLVSRPDGRYLNATPSSGIDKRGCSGRKVAWVDFDRDGLLDLFVNCMERGFVQGQYPKQLYRQRPNGRFTDVAEDRSLSLPDYEIVDFLWVDVDNDGFPDLVTHEDKGYFLYRNRAGATFSREFIGRGPFARADRPQLKGTTDEYWFVDGKLSAADFDGDGYVDVFVASKMGNSLLLNDGKGRLSLVDPASRGLPGASATAIWVDYDNDGRLDLFAVPQGVYRQKADRSFEATGLLAVTPGKHMAAIANWADLDNDGRRDLLLAVLENFSRWNWWEKRRKTPADRFTWTLAAYRNTATDNHWLALRLVGQPGNLQAIGARVTALTADGAQTQVVGLNDGAFFSQGHYRLNFGLGTSSNVETVRIAWPDGRTQELRGLQADRLHVIRQDGAAPQEGTK